MKINDLNKRLKAVETQYCQKPLIVLAIDTQGKSHTMPLKECLSRDDMEFIRVISGESVSDLDLLLENMRNKAFLEVS